MKTLLAGGISIIALASAIQAQDALPQAQDSYFLEAAEQLQRQLALQPNTAQAKNVIFFVVDGLSIPTITASRIYDGQLRNVDGESNRLAFEDLLPWSALSRTYTHDSQVADSAPTATAIVAGVKSVNGTIGVTQAIELGNCASQKGAEVTTIFEQAEAAGLATGIISTARITHATPAAAYAKVAGRDWENDTKLPGDAGENGCKDIAAQLIDWPAGDGFEVIFGGGRSNFMTAEQADPKDAGKTGARQDGRDLVAEWQAKYNDGAYVWNKGEFDAIDPATVSRAFGLFNTSHMQYEAERNGDATGEPSLAEMSVKAVEILQKNDNGFVLMVEGGRVDHAHHAGNAYNAMHDTIAVDTAVKAVMEVINPEETLVILTADHSHVFNISGYPQRNNDILGIAGMADDGKPYTTLGYMNGPGALTDELRADLTDVDTTDPAYLQQALVPLADGETHAGDDVAILAQGPWAHLFTGILDQNVIYHIANHALQLDKRTAN